MNHVLQFRQLHFRGDSLRPAWLYSKGPRGEAANLKPGSKEYKIIPPVDDDGSCSVDRNMKYFFNLKEIWLGLERGKQRVLKQPGQISHSISLISNPRAFCQLCRSLDVAAQYAVLFGRVSAGNDSLNHCSVMPGRGGWQVGVSARVEILVTMHYFLVQDTALNVLSKVDCFRSEYIFYIIKLFISIPISAFLTINSVEDQFLVTTTIK